MQGHGYPPSILSVFLSALTIYTSNTNLGLPAPASAKPGFSLEISGDLWSLTAVKKTVRFLQRSLELSGTGNLAPETRRINGFSPAKT